MLPALCSRGLQPLFETVDIGLKLGQFREPFFVRIAKCVYVIDRAAEFVLQPRDQVETLIDLVQALAALA